MPTGDTFKDSYFSYFNQRKIVKLTDIEYIWTLISF